VRRLTREERIALVEVGPPGEGPVSNETFLECIARGWGYWTETGWRVTDAGRAALARDDAARAVLEDVES
jgi:hypothetical protein